jgi:diaminohydroxyphosphoribosylaminopyrimidine deaminase/5-amino-6-(5-phosphoribosylamino)uracil reductase
MSSKDEDFMRIALSLAEKGRTSPNPKVGAVIVKDGRIIGTGYHRRAGMPHAEIEAMSGLRPDELSGSTLYVSLEPCVHTNKKTPPCVPAIINVGIKKVVCAMKDPNRLVNGRGINALKKAGIEVKVGVLEKEARALNAAYIKYITTGLPLVTMKVAMSLDGKIATKTGESKWISGEASRRYSREMRDKHDGVMVGIGTVLKDNPRLTCRFKSAHDPIRIIVDSKLRIPLNANVLKNARGMVIIGCGKKANERKKKILEKMGVKVFSCPRKDGEVDLKKFLKLVAKNGVLSILLEGGSELDGAMVDADLVDRFCFFIAPKIIGGRDAKSPVGGNGIEKISEALKLKNMNVQRIGVDVLITAEKDARRSE